MEIADAAKHSRKPSRDGYYVACAPMHRENRPQCPNLPLGFV